MRSRPSSNHQGLLISVPSPTPKTAAKKDEKEEKINATGKVTWSKRSSGPRSGSKVTNDLRLVDKLHRLACDDGMIESPTGLL